MRLITDTKTLEQRCHALKSSSVLTVDTEFLREKTYYAQLCLIQVAGEDDFFAIDPLADGIDLTPFYDLMFDEDILKVFHAGRQDIEIFFYETGRVPSPVFDTQIAAMVCGFGDQISYENLIKSTVGAQVDKTSRFTDWSARPLSDKQLEYALGDVTHLRIAYQKLFDQVKKAGRGEWLNDEMEILLSPDTYTVTLEDMWKRVKISTKSQRSLAVLRELAIFRENRAQEKNIPRNRVIRDDALAAIAMNPPRSEENLVSIRGLHKHITDSETMREGLMAAIEKGLECPDNACPRKEKKKPVPPGMAPVIELLRVLLKQTCEAEGIAPKLLCNAADLEQIAAFNNPKVPAMAGWRYDVFGKRAQDLKTGKLAFTLENNEVKVITL